MTGYFLNLLKKNDNPKPRSNRIATGGINSTYSVNYIGKTPSSKVIKRTTVCPLQPVDNTPCTTPSTSTNSTGSSSSTCDKCDGRHMTSACPYYKKDRDKHPDAQRHGKQMGGKSNLPGAVLRDARVIRQPGDGSCLFHSMSYGLRDGSNASSLRREICDFIERHPRLPIADTPLADWVKWDSNSSVGAYLRRMRMGAWGGGIEMASLSIMRGVNVHVYERRGSGFVRISAFDHPQDAHTKKIVRVLYCGGVHFGRIYNSYMYFTYNAV